jgi:hypothetical protein
MRSIVQAKWANETFRCIVSSKVAETVSKNLVNGDLTEETKKELLARLKRDQKFVEGPSDLQFYFHIHPEHKL